MSLHSSPDEERSNLSNWVLEPNPTTNGTTVVHIESGARHEYFHANTLIHNVPHPPFIQPHIWEAQRSQLTFRPDDVFIETFAKCGTTLTEQIVLLLLNGGKDEELNPLHKNTIECASVIDDPDSTSSIGAVKRVGKIWPERAVIDGLAGLEAADGVTTAKDTRRNLCEGEGKGRMSVQTFDALPSPRILKTHAPTQLFLDQDERVAKVLYITRNPFDACVSCYYHPKTGVSPHSTGVPFDAFCKIWLSDRVEFGGWIRHTKGWRRELRRSYNQTKKKNMLWISYEELVHSPLESIRTIAGFLGVDVTTDETLVERVAHGCKFGTVKAAAQARIDGGEIGDISHLRKGQVGDWRAHFDDELFQQFENEIRSQFFQHDGGDDDGDDDDDLEYDIGQGHTWKLRDTSLMKLQQEIDTVPISPKSNNAQEIVTETLKKPRRSTLFSNHILDFSHENTKRLQDIQILGVTVIFYSILQITMQYINEFYADDLRDANGLTKPHNFPAISKVFANVINGVNGGLALSTSIFAGKQIRRVWSGESKFVFWFFVSIVTEALVTSGVLHSMAHALFGATLNGNSYVEVIAHAGYTCNVIITAVLMVCWLAPTYLSNSNNGSTPDWYPRAMEICIAITASVLAVLFTQRWAPYKPNPKDFDFEEDHSYNEDGIVFLQRNVQGVFEGLLLIPTILLLFILHRLWTSIRVSISHSREMRLSLNTYRLCILAVAVPLCLNWIHFRCHDNLVRFIQPALGMEHYELISAIIMVFHLPPWIFAIARIHYFRLLTEERDGWPSLDIIEAICPGREVFPFAMVFLYRATEGMTIALLPSFFGGSDSGYFYLNITDDTWMAVTVLGMFVGNAIGAVSLGFLMQRKGYLFAYKMICVAYLVIFPLYMIPHSNASFLALRSISALLFPGPVVLSKITQNTRREFKGMLRHIPMVVSLVWFNQGFWFGGIISNSAVWTPWNVFFTSAVVLFVLLVCLFIAFLVTSKKKDLAEKGATGPELTRQGTMETRRSTIEDKHMGSFNAEHRDCESGLVTDDDQHTMMRLGSRGTTCNQSMSGPHVMAVIGENDVYSIDEDRRMSAQNDWKEALIIEEGQDKPTSDLHGTIRDSQSTRRTFSTSNLRGSFRSSGQSMRETFSTSNLRGSFRSRGQSMRAIYRTVSTSDIRGTVRTQSMRAIYSSARVLNEGYDDYSIEPVESENAATFTDEQSPRNSLLLARISSFANGASFACHISLLPIQVTKLVALDVYEYTTIVSSLGGISTVLILLSFKSMARVETYFSMAVAYCGHMIGTAILCIPQLYSLPMGAAVSSIVISYGVILLSFFVMNLSCEVSLGQKSLQQKIKKDAAAGLQMGIIKGLLSLGKVCGAAMVTFAFRFHPQLPLWILEAFLLTCSSLAAAVHLLK